MKGRAELREATSDDLVLAQNFVRRMSDCLTGLGVVPAAASRWFSLRDVVVTRLGIEAVFVQTPGAQAGTPVDSTARSTARVSSVIPEPDT